MNYEQAYDCLSYLVDKSFDTTSSEECRFQAHRVSYIFKGYLDMLKRNENPHSDYRWNEFAGNHSASNCGAVAFINSLISTMQINAVIAKM